MISILSKINTVQYTKPYIISPTKCKTRLNKILTIKMQCSHKNHHSSKLLLYSIYLSHTEQDTIAFILGFVIVCVAVIS